MVTFSGYIKSEVPIGCLKYLYGCACYLGEIGLGVYTLELELQEVKWVIVPEKDGRLIHHTDKNIFLYTSDTKLENAMKMQILLKQQQDIKFLAINIIHDKEIYLKTL